ncbi:response regulator [Chthonobacter rhizosphaerae]|uniref:response regulator n=1 Tax=Chthonobacter rhizosphaerae TaxID=2735553 RepID=UPI0015EECF31
MGGNERPGSPARDTADAHILLIEDDEDDVRVITRLLDQAPISFRITTAENGREALDWLAGVGSLDDPAAPDLVILDINMPVMDGMLFLSELRRNPVFRSLPVVTLTTSTDPDTIRRAYDFGANAVVNKADSLDGMSQIVNTTVDFWFRIAHRYYID